MKKIIALLLIGIILMQLSACGGGSSPVSEQNTSTTGETEESKNSETSSPKNEEGSGTVGDFEIKIGDAFTATDHEGKPAIVISYNWTNNSDDTTSAMSSLMEQAFQDGVELESAILDSEIDGYDSEANMKDIRPGVNLDVQRAFVLTSDSPVEFEVSEFMGFDDPVVKKFDLTGMEINLQTDVEKENLAEDSEAVEDEEGISDFSGTWKQIDSDGKEMYQIAEIQDNIIKIYWYTEADETKALYWSGSFIAPDTTNGSYTWESENDHTETDSALLASSDDTKTFTVENGIISYEVTAMGVTKTVDLEKE